MCILCFMEFYIQLYECLLTSSISTRYCNESQTTIRHPGCLCACKVTVFIHLASWCWGQMRKERSAFLLANCFFLLLILPPLWKALSTFLSALDSTLRSQPSLCLSCGPNYFGGARAAPMWLRDSVIVQEGLWTLPAFLSVGWREEPGCLGVGSGWILLHRVSLGCWIPKLHSFSLSSRQVPLELLLVWLRPSGLFKIGSLYCPVSISFVLLGFTVSGWFINITEPPWGWFISKPESALSWLILKRPCGPSCKHYITLIHT